jgi:DNA-binding transcriptional ArsR family regulator
LLKEVSVTVATEDPFTHRPFRDRGFFTRSSGVGEMGAEEPAPAEAFGALADTTRVEILRALDGTFKRTRSFSTLRSAVEVTDSGQFNYHLSRLRPHFVEKDGDGYRLTSTGRQVARAVAAGRFTEDARVEPFEHESGCHCCGTQLVVSYRDGRLRFRCPECDRQLLNAAFPASGVRDREPDQIVDVFARSSRHRVIQARDGVCPDCSGPTTGHVSDDFPSAIDKPAVVVFDCTVCGGAVVTSFGGLAAYDSRVRAFHDERGVDLTDGYYWELPQCLSGDYTVVRSTDPWRTTVRFPVDDDLCLARFEGCDLVTVERPNGDGAR